MGDQSDERAVIRQAVQDVYEEKVPDKIPESLPLLSRFSDRFSHQKMFANAEAGYSASPWPSYPKSSGNGGGWA
ncbi:MAG: hypothetical protein ACXV5H_07085 [Halobacteriota archaeon]